MDGLIKKGSDTILRHGIEKASQGILKKASEINPVETLNSILQSYTDYKKIAAQAEVDINKIDAWKRVELERIQSQRDLLMTYLEKSFDEREKNFKQLFELLDNTIETAVIEKDKKIEVISKTLQSITDIAKSSPFKGIKELEKELEDKNKAIDL